MNLYAYKLSRRGYVVKCGNCGAEGHNIRSCPQPSDPNKKAWKKKTKNSAATDAPRGVDQQEGPSEADARHGNNYEHGPPETTLPETTQGED
ncbi:hypothetical protein CJ030_MR2G005629 [Morella rubra]|uniref:CCHC-type domain-containing protein n=1 Tax=Morella rubra TaxID=262757 RepID=A0A6A1WAI3_9ROSI|nr:hypothetical protein CJ030_MR2G005629 [Morella rubra]